MQYISFYKDRLPFKPKSNVVIYFDVMGHGIKRYFHILNDYYDDVVEEFQKGGLEFCFLPRIAQDMDLKKIYHYFNPQASEEDAMPHLNLYNDKDLLEYIVADYDPFRLSPGLIQYMGKEFDKQDSYTFSYTPIPKGTDRFLQFLYFLKGYVNQYGVGDAFFDRTHPQPTREIIEENDVDMMMSEVQTLVEQLRQSGVGEIALQRIFKPTQKLSRLHIRYGRVFLPDYNNKEIKMPPLSKAIYMLYLRHPEGIMFSYLPDYRDELLHLYGLISGRDSKEDIRRSIDDVTDPTRNSINEKCSRIKQAFLREFDDSIARNYYITGERGEVKKILLPTEMVTWDMPD